MLKYIVSGQKPISTNTDIDAIDKIVAKVKGREEVTTAFMKQWDRELSIKREAEEKTKEEAALQDIRFDRKYSIPEEITRARLEHMGYKNNAINEFFAKIDAEEKDAVANK